MKKTLFISLLFVAVFLIGSSGAQGPVFMCYDHQDYSCAGTTYHYGEITDTWTDCTTLCYDDPFFVGITNVFLDGILYPATSYEHLLGTAYSSDGWLGCSVDFKGRSIIVKESMIEQDEGVVYILNCMPCNNCCRLEEQ